MSAIRYLKSITPVIRKSEGVNSKCESAIFRLHNKFTVAILIGSSIMLTATEFFGKPIDCITDLPRNVINTYCWITSTFTMQDYYDREVGSKIPAPGISTPYMDDEVMQKRWTFHNYYQWVVFILFFQAALCYFPKYVWKSCEGGLMRSLSEHLTKGLYKSDDVTTKKKVVVDYITTHIKMHNGYAFKYFGCELLCFINIIFQMFMIDKFLGGEFMQYGFKVLEFSEDDQDTRVDPMIYVFPRLTKCTFHMYGASGTVESRDAFCLLPQNILNEKIFIFIWFWYVILGFLLGGLVVYRILLVLLPGIRSKMIYAHTRMVPMDTLQVITQKTSLGDWWILYILASVVDPHIYRDILMKLAKEIEISASSRSVCKSNGSGAGSNGAATAPALYSQSSV